MKIAKTPQTIHFQILKSPRTKWDEKFLKVAALVSTFSKDPSTKVGAVICDQNNRFVSLGYNGFARGVSDSQERLSNRDLKYKLVIHAEQNALLFAQRNLTGHTLYTWPFPPCSNCSQLIIQSGVARVVAPMPTEDQEERWGDSFQLAIETFKEAKIITEFIEEI